jgi:hypothetical protein
MNSSLNKMLGTDRARFFQDARKHKERVGGFCPRWFAPVPSPWTAFGKNLGLTPLCSTYKEMTATYDAAASSCRKIASSCRDIIWPYHKIIALYDKSISLYDKVMSSYNNVASSYHEMSKNCNGMGHSHLNFGHATTGRQTSNRQRREVTKFGRRGIP